MDCISSKLLNDLDKMIVTLAWKCPEETTKEWRLSIDGWTYHIIEGSTQMNNDVYKKFSTKTIFEIKEIIFYSSMTPPYSYELYNFLLNLETIQKVEKIENTQQSLIIKLNENNDLYSQINDKLALLVGLIDLKTQEKANEKI